MTIEIGDLVQRFDSGEIRLPLMQRDYVWKPKKVVRLLDSLYRGWPIGSFYIWQTGNQYPTRSRYGSKTPPLKHLDGFCGFLLDGQQRLTSLSVATKGDGEAELKDRAYFDLENEQFYLGEMKKTISRRIEARDPLLVPLSEIFFLARSDDSAFLRVVENILGELGEQKKLGKNDVKGEQYRQRLHQLGKMLRKKALCEEFQDEHEGDAFELFSRLNKGGTSLSVGEVEAARLASAATKKIVDPMRSVAAEYEFRALGINFVFLLRCLVTVHRDNCSFSKLPQNWANDPGEVESSWKTTERAFRATVRFVANEIGWKTRRWLPSTMAMIPVVYLFAKTGKTTLNGKEREFVKRYLLITGLRGLFQGSTETMVNSFVNAIRNTPGDPSRRAKALFDRIPKNRLFKIRKEDIANTTGLYSPLMQVYLAFLYDKDAGSWPSLRSLRNVLNEGLTNDPLAVHHIFPKKFMQDRDIPVEQLNIVANYAILSQPDNAELGERDPIDVWREMKQNQKDCASQQLCFFGLDSLLRYDAYEEFVENRSKKVADQLNEYLKLGRQ